MKTTQSVRISAIQPVCRTVFTEKDESRTLQSIQENIDHLCGLLQQAGKEQTDIVCMPEDILGIAGLTANPSQKPFFKTLVQKSEASMLEKVSQRARENNMYVVGCSYLTRGEDLTNSCFLIDRSGNIAGTYQKTHLPPGEDAFFTPGHTYPVFETDFGKIGMIICWDMMFPEPARILMLEGAKIIFCPTLGFDFGGEHLGEMRVRMRAFDNAVYIVNSTYASPGETQIGRSCIVSPQGVMLADAGYSADKVIWADIDPNRRTPDLADPENKQGLDMQSRFRKCRRPETYRRLLES